MPFAIELECPICKKKYDLQDWLEDTCGFRLRIVYDKENRANSTKKSDYQDFKRISHWKYHNFFPLEKTQNQLSIGEGGTNLVRSKRLGEKLGLKHLYFKLESSNPSASFKDRPISVGASVAFENKAIAISAASSGNAAAALASYGAKGGIKTVVFVPERTSTSKVAQLVTLGATVVRVQDSDSVKGDPSVKLFKDAVNEWKWTPCPSFGPFNPHQFEGTKSLAFEVIEQLDWEVPDFVLCNTGSGGLMGGVSQGFVDWQELDWISSLPQMVVVQPDSCDPIVQAFNKRVKPFEFNDIEGFPDTVAGGLADPHPWDGDTALEMLYLTKGDAVSVSDPAILKGQRILASHEGIFGSPTGVASIAGLQKMADDGKFDASDLIVIPITDHGLKDPQVLEEQVKKAIISKPSISDLAPKLDK